MAIGFRGVGTSWAFAVARGLTVTEIGIGIARTSAIVAGTSTGTMTGTEIATTIATGIIFVAKPQPASESAASPQGEAAFLHGDRVQAPNHEC
jgi:hypothetical protein